MLHLGDPQQLAAQVQLLELLSCGQAGVPHTDAPLCSAPSSAAFPEAAPGSLGPKPPAGESRGKERQSGSQGQELEFQDLCIRAWGSGLEFQHWRC